VDRITPSERSRVMACVRARDTRPERRVRSLLHRLGYRFRLHRQGLPGRPDLVLPKYRAVVFIHGCFWHGHTCPKGVTKPASNRAFWDKKLRDNKARDARNRGELEALGWKVIVVWECAAADETALARVLTRALGGPRGTGSSRASAAPAG